MTADFVAHRIAPARGRFRAALAAGFIAVGVAVSSGCASSPPSQNADPLNSGGTSANADLIGARTESLKAEISIESPTVAVGSFEMTIRFDPAQIILIDVEPLVPEPIRLHVDRKQFASGDVRIVGTNTAPMESDPGAIRRQHGPTGTFLVARLIFKPADGMEEIITTEQPTWKFLACRAFSPLPEQESIPAKFKVQFSRVVKVPAGSS